jgi:hypothetical protein
VVHLVSAGMGEILTLKARVARRATRRRAVGFLFLILILIL